MQKRCVESKLNGYKKMNRAKSKIYTLIGISFILSGCAGFNLDFLKLKRTPETIIKQTKIPTQWQAALPHGGTVANLNQFWQQFDDALLLELINSAQQVSSNVASAKARIAQARAARISTNANTLPTLDGSFSASRALQQPNSTGGGAQGFNFNPGATNTTQIGLQSVWELDLFGANKILVESAKMTENAAEANWHEARVAVAAELATSYFNQRYCHASLAVIAKDLASRQQSTRLTAISVKAGFAAQASQYLAEASLADAKQQLNAQQAQCDSNIKELVALTDLDEKILREKLNQQIFLTDALKNKNLYEINTIPAKTIAQRPDIYNAEAELVAAAATVQSRQAARLPRVSLSGSIGWLKSSSNTFSSNGEVWSLGPLSITLPIFDGGKRKSAVSEAEAQYEASAANYRSRVRTAVKEVEQALVSLHSAELRQADLQQALSNYKASFSATEAKVRAGFANLIELETSRRDALQTETNLLNLLQNRTNAWVSLYRAAGGDWYANSVTSKENMQTESTK